MKLDPFRWWRLLRGMGEKAQPHRKITGMSMQSPAFIASHTHFLGWVVVRGGVLGYRISKSSFWLICSQRSSDRNKNKKAPLLLILEYGKREVAEEEKYFNSPPPPTHASIQASRVMGF